MARSAREAKVGQFVTPIKTFEAYNHTFVEGNVYTVFTEITNMSSQLAIRPTSPREAAVFDSRFSGSGRVGSKKVYFLMPEKLRYLYSPKEVLRIVAALSNCIQFHLGANYSFSNIPDQASIDTPFRIKVKFNAAPTQPAFEINFHSKEVEDYENCLNDEQELNSFIERIQNAIIFSEARDGTEVMI